ncbi:MAG: hypothetical protein Q4F83_04895 [Eubacteriales bacterium]|nr:hypothetical protein [Eubacteriales bacterium]
MADELTTKKATDLTENTAMSEEDLLIVGNEGTASLRKVKFSNVLTAIKTKLAEWVFDSLPTEDKTITGALNELNTNKADFENNGMKFALKDGTIEARLRRVGSAGLYALGIAVETAGKTVYNNLINPDGSCNFVMRRGQSGAVGNTIKPVYVNEVGNVAECAMCAVLGVQSVSGSTSAAVAPGSTGTITINFSAVAGASKYVAIPKSTSFGCGISSLSISGTKITATLFSVYDTHTLTAAFDIIALAV